MGKHGSAGRALVSRPGKGRRVGGDFCGRGWVLQLVLILFLVYTGGGGGGGGGAFVRVSGLRGVERFGRWILTRVQPLGVHRVLDAGAIVLRRER